MIRHTKVNMTEAAELASTILAELGAEIAKQRNAK